MAISRKSKMAVKNLIPVGPPEMANVPSPLVGKYEEYIPLQIAQKMCPDATNMFMTLVQLGNLAIL